MKILSIDASGKNLSLCLRLAGREAGRLDQPLDRIELLPALVSAFCKQYELVPQEISALAVVNGPGSYAGLRGSLLLAKSMALLKAVPIMTRLRHEVALYACHHLETEVLISQFVRQEQYYLSLGRFQNGQVIYRQASHLSTATELIDWQTKLNCPVGGDWPETAEKPSDYLDISELAPALAEWTESDFQPMSPDSLLPFYIRPAVRPAT